MAHCTHKCIFFDSQIADDHRICDEGEPYVFLDQEWLIPCCNRHAAGRATDPENDNRMTPQQIIDYHRKKTTITSKKLSPNHLGATSILGTLTQTTTIGLLSIQLVGFIHLKKYDLFVLSIK